MESVGFRSFQAIDSECVPFIGDAGQLFVPLQSNLVAFDSNTLPANFIAGFPFKIEGLCEIVTKKAYLNCTSSALSGALRFAIYADNGNFYPSNKISAEVLFDCSSTGVKSGTFILTLRPNTIYHLVFVGAAAPIYRCLNVNGTRSIIGIKSDFTISKGWVKAFTYGNLPAEFPSAATIYQSTGILPAVGLEIERRW